MVISEVDLDKKKMILSLRAPAAQKANKMEGEKKEEVDFSAALQSLPKDRWMQAVVQSATEFGIFVRPAGYDVKGLVHRSRIPRALINALKTKAGVASGGNSTDVSAVLSQGDVVKVRVHNVAQGSNRLELTMLPLQEDDDDDAFIPDYLLEEGMEEELDEFTQSFEDDDEGSPTFFDAESTLLWWRGAPYTSSAHADEVVVDEEVEVINESPNVVEGSWRRMFEIDLREDTADSTTKLLDEEIRELDAEIGELAELDGDIADAGGFGIKVNRRVAGNFISIADLPAEWTKEIEAIQAREEMEATVITKLRGGKTTEQSELEAVMRMAESNIDEPKPKNVKVDVAEPSTSAGEPEAEEGDDESDDLEAHPPLEGAASA